MALSNGGSPEGRAGRRAPGPAAGRAPRRLDALPDRVDIRDWAYRPGLTGLPDRLVNCDAVPAILDQGREGACTGFALAAAINFLLRARNVQRTVSPRMLYEMARRYDEWPGERYEGSTARGAMKGWVAHGVASRQSWPDRRAGLRHMTPEIAREARLTPGGAYYRVTHRSIRDMHAALAEAGILYVTLMVHDGWLAPGPTLQSVQYGEPGSPRQRTFPVIRRQGRAHSGHAVAIVGYTEDGFIVQNSWGPSWGSGGFALLPYEDYLLHATDVWVAQLGVPVTVDLWERGEADTAAGVHRATSAIPLDEIRPYVVDLARNGELSSSGQYWTTEADLQRLFTDLIPRSTRAGGPARLVLWVHGGLSSEQEVAQRTVAFRDVLLENQIYPLHIMWEAGLGESLRAILRDLVAEGDGGGAPVKDWLDTFRQGLVEAKDRTLELTAAGPGGAMWRELKEHARRASAHPRRKGGIQLMARYAAAAIQGLTGAERRRWELHVVAHSAGAIFAAYALPHLATIGVTFKTLQFLAPAITAELFKRAVLPYVAAGRCPHPTNYVLSDQAERDDAVGAYGKSLLYLVSNAFEPRHETPLLGMERFVTGGAAGDRGRTDPVLRRLFVRSVAGLPSLVVAGRPGGPASRSRSTTHDGFEKDLDTLNAVLWRILGRRPARPFTARDLPS
jgi:hypothetical protein